MNTQEIQVVINKLVQEYILAQLQTLLHTELTASMDSAAIEEQLNNLSTSLPDNSLLHHAYMVCATVDTIIEVCTQTSDNTLINKLHGMLDMLEIKPK